MLFDAPERRNGKKQGSELPFELSTIIREGQSLNHGCDFQFTRIYGKKEERRYRTQLKENQGPEAHLKSLCFV